jgi:hypothetical protein
VPPRESPQRRLVEHVLGIRDIGRYVEQRMASGLSRRAVAKEISERIGLEHAVTEDQLRRWRPR